MSAAAIISPSPAPTTASGTRFEKLCLRDPAAFAAYYGNAIIALVSEAWLGPAYQITSQLNVVNPGGAAQVAHRDYHLGFQSAGGDRALSRPCASPLAGADPARGGRALRHAARDGADALPAVLAGLPARLHGDRAAPSFADYFDKHHVQLPLSKGDAVFFNPALFHAAGTNRSKDVRRIANLLQVSSAFGRAMESVDRLKMSVDALSGAERPAIGEGRSRRRRPTTPSPLAPRVTRSRPISTATRRKAASRPRPSRI